MGARVLVAGVGNVFLGDDGFGAEAARQLRARSLPTGVEVVDYGVRGMHLVYDLLDGYDALVVLDAVQHEAAPGDVSVLEVDQADAGTGEVDAPGMAPIDVLSGLALLGGQLPRTFVVACEPTEVAERMGLSGPVERAVPLAVDSVLDLLDHELGLHSG